MSFFCPTEEQVRTQVFSLLPRGRAWQTNEGGPIKGWEPGFNLDAFNPDAFTTTSRKPSILWQYWAAFAREAWYFAKSMCELRLEFWCASHTKTNDGWLIEYGLPDACDPFPDLCLKVAAVGGTRCEYYAAVAARAGWSIECSDKGSWCGSLPGRGQAGCFRPGRRSASLLFILVHLADSPAYGGTLSPIPKAGRMKAGRMLGCGPNISALECLLARVVHAEIKIQYEVTP